MEMSLTARILLGALCAAAMTGDANANGAIAIGGNEKDKSQGIAFGLSFNMATNAGAELRAIQECLKIAVAPAEARADCKIIAHFTHEWIAVAMDRSAGAPGFGWSAGADQASAQSAARESCLETSPESRRAFCEVVQLYRDEQP